MEFNPDSQRMICQMQSTFDGQSVFIDATDVMRRNVMYTVALGILEELREESAYRELAASPFFDDEDEFADCVIVAPDKFAGKTFDEYRNLRHLERMSDEEREHYIESRVSQFSEELDLDSIGDRLLEEASIPDVPEFIPDMVDSVVDGVGELKAKAVAYLESNHPGLSRDAIEPIVAAYGATWMSYFGNELLDHGMRADDSVRSVLADIRREIDDVKRDVEVYEGGIVDGSLLPLCFYPGTFVDGM